MRPIALGRRIYRGPSACPARFDNPPRTIARSDPGLCTGNLEIRPGDPKFAPAPRKSAGNLQIRCRHTSVLLGLAVARCRRTRHPQRRLHAYTKWRRSPSEQLTAVQDNAMYTRMKRLSPMWTEPCLREQRTLFGSRTYGLVAANRRDPHRRGGGVLAG